jgi:hypothetical protein
MSNTLYGIVPAAFINAIATLIAADGTAAKVLIEPQAAAAATATTPLFYGGGTAIDITAASSDTVAKDVILWHGQVLTTVGASTGTAATTTGTITRTTGSFITDGWKPGDLVMVFNAPDQARQAGVDGVLGIVTAVTATTLTVNGTPFSAATITSGARICRMAQDLRAPVQAGAGTNGTTANAALLNNTLDSSILRTERKLGANELLAVSVASAVSALPAYINVGAQVARY